MFGIPIKPVLRTADNPGMIWKRNQPTDRRRELEEAETREVPILPKPPPRGEAKVIVSLPADLAERVRNAAYWLSGTKYASISTILAEALQRELDHLEQTHNGGETFPARSPDDLDAARELTAFVPGRLL